VDLVSEYSNRPDLLEDLRRVQERLAAALRQPRAPRRSVTGKPRSHPERVRLTERLSAEDVQALIDKFRSGMTIKELSLTYGISMTRVSL
jgi:hypothetical protein